MTKPFQRFRRFLRELRRRRVYNVAAVYAAVAFVTLQAAQLIFPATTLEGIYDVLVVIAFVGFPMALVVAWAFEVTPEGVRRTPEAEPPEEGHAEGGSGLSTGYEVLVGLGLVAAAMAGGWYLTGGGGGGDETTPRLGDGSIAVLPFEALGQEEPGTFTEGMHDDLLARLSNISDLRVISRTAVQQYQDTDKTTGEIARELGVRWVLEGGVQEMGDQIQVNAQLIDPRTETHAWVETYQRDLTTQDLFDLQGEITRRIARSLEAQLTAEETERVERRPTENLNAYQLYIRGRRQFDTRTEEGFRKALDSFRRAVRRDSTYALAWSGLADVIGLYEVYGPDSLPASVPDHEQAARRAVELAPSLAEARASLGFVRYQQLDGPAALRELERSVNLKPSYAQGHHWLGWLYLHLGKPQLARQHLSVAVELAPDHTTARTALATVLLAQGEVTRADTVLAEIPEERRHLTQYQAPKAYLLSSTGRWEELAAFSRQRLRGARGTPLLAVALHRFHLGRIGLRRGDTAGAHEHLAAVRKVEPSQRRYVYEGLLSAALGETEMAFEVWRKMEAWGGPAQWSFRYLYPDLLDPLRTDARYQGVIRTLNRGWGLNPDGSLPDSVDVSFDPPSDD